MKALASAKKCWSRDLFYCFLVVFLLYRYIHHDLSLSWIFSFIPDVFFEVVTIKSSETKILSLCVFFLKK